MADASCSPHAEAELELNANPHSLHFQVESEKQDYLVEFDGESDPLHPLNWDMKTKYIHCYPHEGFLILNY